MASVNFSDLEKEYDYFQYPVLQVLVDDKDIVENKSNFSVSDVEVINTCEYEASMASFTIYNSYSRNEKRFMFKELKNYTQIGSCVVISLGYNMIVREVFRGFISNVSYVLSQGKAGVVVTCMDIKGIMMSGNYSAQLTATSYSEAVKEILKRTIYEKLQSSNVVLSLEGISDTPDKKQGSEDNKDSDVYIEMVAESDYEFVVKAAKKYNYEFFTLGGNVYFREAKSIKDKLIDLDADTGLTNVDVEYDITGQVGYIEVRNMDSSSNDMYTTKKKLSNLDGKVKSLVSSIGKVYIDPTVRSKEDSGYRAAYLENDISYRFGTVHAEFVGLPELSPGYFVGLNIFGSDKPLDFYLTEVRHVLDDDGFATYVTGKAAKMGTI